MSGLIERIKKPLRPLIRTLRRKTGFLNTYEQQQSLIEQSFKIFTALCGSKEIAKIHFENNKCILTLKDDRQYYFDPFDRVARMYSVPHIGTFEEKETDFLRGLIKPGQVCFDIGGNFGWYTVLLSQLTGTKGHIHTFEPIPQTFEILKSNVNLNQLTNVTLNQLALDEQIGAEKLFLPDIGVSGSFKLHDYAKAYETIESPTSSLDSYCSRNKIDNISFIKADIEGAEWRVLKGGVETLREYRPVLLVEIQESSTKLFGYQPMELFKWLKQLGYSPFFVARDRALVPVKDYSGNLPDYNFFFFPEE